MHTTLIQKVQNHELEIRSLNIKSNDLEKKVENLTKENKYLIDQFTRLNQALPYLFVAYDPNESTQNRMKNLLAIFFQLLNTNDSLNQFFCDVYQKFNEIKNDNVNVKHLLNMVETNHLTLTNDNLSLRAINSQQEGRITRLEADAKKQLSDIYAIKKALIQNNKDMIKRTTENLNQINGLSLGLLPPIYNRKGT